MGFMMHMSILTLPLAFLTPPAMPGPLHTSKSCKRKSGVSDCLTCHTLFSRRKTGSLACKFLSQSLIHCSVQNVPHLYICVFPPTRTKLVSFKHKFSFYCPLPEFHLVLSVHCVLCCHNFSHCFHLKFLASLIHFFISLRQAFLVSTSQRLTPSSVGALWFYIQNLKMVIWFYTRDKSLRNNIYTLREGQNDET